MSSDIADLYGHIMSRVESTMTLVPGTTKSSGGLSEATGKLPVYTVDPGVIKVRVMVKPMIPLHAYPP